MRKVCFIVEIVVTISILFFFSAIYNHFILPQIDYIRFLQMLPGKYINERPYEDDCGNLLISRLKEPYRLHFEEHQTINEIYSCEASASPCYVSVDVWVISDALGEALFPAEERQNSTLSKLLVEKSFSTNWNVEQNQPVLIKSAANTIYAEVFQFIPYSGFPTYEHESRASIFLISSTLRSGMLDGELFSINSNHIASLREFDISELIGRAHDHFMFFYIMFGIVIFCWVTCCVAINWKIYEISKYISHLVRLGASIGKTRIKKTLFLLFCFISSGLPGCIASIGVNDLIANIYFVVISACYFCLFLWILIK